MIIIEYFIIFLRSISVKDAMTGHEKVKDKNEKAADKSEAATSASDPCILYVHSCSLYDMIMFY